MWWVPLIVVQHSWSYGQMRCCSCNSVQCCRCEDGRKQGGVFSNTACWLHCVLLLAVLRWALQGIFSISLACKWVNRDNVKKLLLCDFLSQSAISVAIVSSHQSPLRTAGARAQRSEDGLLAKDQFDALLFQLFSWRLNSHMLSTSHLSCWCNYRFTLFACHRIAERSALPQRVQGNVASMLEVCPSNSKV